VYENNKLAENYSKAVEISSTRPNGNGYATAKSYIYTINNSNVGNVNLGLISRKNYDMAICSEPSITPKKVEVLGSTGIIFSSSSLSNNVSLSADIKSNATSMNLYYEVRLYNISARNSLIIKDFSVYYNSQNLTLKQVLDNSGRDVTNMVSQRNGEINISGLNEAINSGRYLTYQFIFSAINPAISFTNNTSVRINTVSLYQPPTTLISDNLLDNNEWYNSVSNWIGSDIDSRSYPDVVVYEDGVDTNSLYIKYE